MTASEGKHTQAPTHHEGAFGLEGVGAARVEVCVVVGLQEADVVEALGLRAGSKDIHYLFFFTLAEFSKHWHLNNNLLLCQPKRTVAGIF